MENGPQHGGRGVKYVLPPSPALLWLKISRTFLRTAHCEPYVCMKNIVFVTGFSIFCLRRLNTTQPIPKKGIRL